MSDISTAWSMFENALRDKISDNQKWEGLQLVQVPQPADWNNASTGQWEICEFWGNTMNAWSSGWARTGKSVDSAYFSFLMNLDLKPPKDLSDDDKKKLDDAKKDFDNAVQTREKDQTKVGKEWNKFNTSQINMPPSGQVPFQTWYAQNWGTRISADTLDVQAKQQKYVSLWKQYSGTMQDVAQAIIDYNNPAYQTGATDPSGAALQYRAFSISPDLGTFIADAKAGTGSSLYISFDSKTSSESKSAFSASGSASYSAPFWGASASGGYSQTKIDTSSTDFSCTISFPSWQLFTVTPGQWFNGSVIAEYGNDTDKWIDKDAKFFGPDGSFNLITSQLVVAYQPKITIKMSRDDFSSVSKEWKAAASVNVGSFKFNLESGGGSDSIQTSDSSQTITLQTTSATPQVIAVINNVLPSFNL
ncbi:hypothetical protein [Paenibacillus hamazuiensis]|uniref:hypothetical protein n=1 Tax=Paenibacillus hamazuiensis TaxID=2936508 RepID=UPI0020106A98|nr:hypothetical protein [Paenibacillus hamazuiensis]